MHQFTVHIMMGLQPASLSPVSLGFTLWFHTVTAAVSAAADGITASSPQPRSVMSMQCRTLMGIWPGSPLPKLRLVRLGGLHAVSHCEGLEHIPLAHCLEILPGPRHPAAPALEPYGDCEDQVDEHP